MDGGNKCIKWLIFIFNFIFFVSWIILLSKFCDLSKSFCKGFIHTEGEGPQANTYIFETDYKPSQPFTVSKPWMETSEKCVKPVQS